jgi:two-component system, chemotaxis family, sensor kinase CheA
LEIITNILGQDFLKTKEILSISSEKLTEVEKKIVKTFPEEISGKVLSILNELKYSNLKDLLLQYNDSLKNLSVKFDKCISNMVISGEDIYIDKNKYTKVIKALVHIFRNSIDHGIEQPEERLIKHKPEYGTIECRLEKINNSSFKLRIRDDGNGISREKVIKKAVEKGILRESEANQLSQKKVMDILFIDGFSTKEDISVVSGRGIGLSAVKAEIIKHGGEICIYSEPDKYTEFDIALPIYS